MAFPSVEDVALFLLLSSVQFLGFVSGKSEPTHSSSNKDCCCLSMSSKGVTHRESYTLNGYVVARQTESLRGETHLSQEAWEQHLPNRFRNIAKL